MKYISRLLRKTLQSFFVLVLVSTCWIQLGSAQTKPKLKPDPTRTGEVFDARRTGEAWQVRQMREPWVEGRSASEVYTIKDQIEYNKQIFPENAAKDSDPGDVTPATEIPTKTSGPQVYGFLKDKNTHWDAISAALEDFDREQAAKKNQACGLSPEISDPFVKRYVTSIEKIDRNLRAEALEPPPVDRRFKGYCLRAIKFAMCNSASLPNPKNQRDMNTKIGECLKSEAGYPAVAKAKDYPIALEKKGTWKNIMCDSSMTPESAPPGALLCYEAIENSDFPSGMKGKKDLTHQYGHCEVKVSNCKYCFDGCASRPRTGGGAFSEERNRKLVSVMVTAKQTTSLGRRPCKIGTVISPPQSIEEILGNPEIR